jgi:2-desacetyl-2-hydroxyethyl bacteriochlorophyllide A dehydrogenase
MNEMKAIQIEEPGRVVIIEKDIPALTAEEVMLRIKYVGLCGSDLSTYNGSNPLVQYPRIPGHEISASIEETGSGVPDHLKKGQKVTLVPYTNCGKCPSCKSGRPNACQFNQTMGVQRDGAMCEYLAVPWQKVLFSNHLDEKQLVLVEPLTVGFHAIARADVTNADTVMVLGCGMIGAGAVTRAKYLGAKVIAVDIDNKKLLMAEKLGADFIINSAEQDLHGRLTEITSREGPGVVIEAAGNPVTYRIAVEEVAFCGRVVGIGYAKDDVALATSLFVQKEMDIRGSRNATTSDFVIVIRFLEENIFPVDEVISKIVTPEETIVALREWSENPGKYLKIMVEF